MTPRLQPATPVTRNTCLDAFTRLVMQKIHDKDRLLNEEQQVNDKLVQKLRAIASITEALNTKLERAQAKTKEAIDRAREAEQHAGEQQLEITALKQRLEVLSGNTSAQLSIFGKGDVLPSPVITQSNSVRRETSDQEASESAAERRFEEEQQ
ncbi:hypothetical protein GGI25_004909 [Coemansia spiralis]|uniref:Uncharacterized protein n=2 Tax=Coemansia TaxID=4863 RepID=A0A9W8G3M9_9FUNG|nr:hypothetical protein BX070DRAFT_231546 [Coemansia spiralis]KAJ1990815.1 hypothetical protein EDC05_003795 [Coemansia umbellata]KAJ2622601.1 hypothetical protein GGI26_003047 [Coemansia sp. RSA 1358]KAJ2672928.1 hypothetical protein GGI25_004909 [Coemansia spiralis]